MNQHTKRHRAAMEASKIKCIECWREFVPDDENDIYCSCSCMDIQPKHTDELDDFIRDAGQGVPD